MKEIIYSLIVASCVFCAGCGKEEEKNPVAAAAAEAVKSYADAAAREAARAVDPAEYKALLEKRAASVDGANINIKLEVSKFEKASDAEKRELYNSVKDLVK